MFTKKVGNITMYENVKIIRSDRSAPLGAEFVGETVCDGKYMIERNSSDVLSLEYIVAGKGTLEINGQVLHPKKGDVFLLTKGSCHRYFSDASDPWHKYFFSVYGPVADALVENYLPKDTYLFENCLVINNFSHIFDIAFNNDDPSEFQPLIANEIFKIFNCIYEHRKIETEDLADKIKRNIEAHIADEFNLENLCRDMNYSKNHIINIFSEKFGQTPYQYYKESKIKLAKDYLITTKMTVGEISAALSYSDQQYFSYSFKKETGYSPKKYREYMKV